MASEDGKIIVHTENTNNRLAFWSFGLSLFSLFGYIIMIFALAPVGALLYLFLSKTSSDFLSTPIIIFLWTIEFISIASGLGAMVLGILVLSKKESKKKLFAILSILMGFLGFLYHAHYLFFK